MRLFSDKGDSSCACVSNTTPTQLFVVDTFKYTIKEIIQVGEFTISIINYPGCKNFNGDKVILWYPYVSEEDIRNSVSIDPHFIQDSGILARFEPTEIGITAAKILAEALTDECIE